MPRPQDRPTDARRPNIIWVFGDQHRGSALSCAGDPNVHTPNIDRLAAEGVWFRNAVMGFPLCCPCRGSLLTGVYPHRCVPGHEIRMPPELPTIAEPFNGSGYHTAYLGKWHLDGAKEASVDAAYHIVPPERRGGFKTWIGYENNNAQFDCYVHGHDGDTPVDHHKLPRFETDALTDLALDQIDRHRDEPFFLALSVQPPHDPYTAPAEWMQRHNLARIQLRPNVPDIPRIREQARRELAGYYALIENLDHNLGRIRQRLEDHGLTDHTYILFFSDHGDHHGSHGHFRKMTPYQESIHVPFIIAGPCNRHYAISHRS
ncbi:MAG: sulfatase-like hydrolase/transferase, partial [Planctomycetota bacterium]